MMKVFYLMAQEPNINTYLDHSKSEVYVDTHAKYQRKEPQLFSSAKSLRASLWGTGVGRIIRDNKAYSSIRNVNVVEMDFTNNKKTITPLVKWFLDTSPKKTKDDGRFKIFKIETPFGWSKGGYDAAQFKFKRHFVLSPTTNAKGKTWSRAGDVTSHLRMGGTPPNTVLQDVYVVTFWPMHGKYQKIPYKKWMAGERPNFDIAARVV